jgi:hypothetical protein
LTAAKSHLQASTEERKYFNTEDVNRHRKIRKNNNNNNIIPPHVFEMPL